MLMIIFISSFILFSSLSLPQLAENRATHFRQEKGGLGPLAHNAAAIPYLSRRMYAQMDNIKQDPFSRKEMEQ